MAIAALTVSLIAVLISGGAFWNSTKALRIESARRHEERTPQLEVSYNDFDGEAPPKVRIVNSGPEDLSGLELGLQPSAGPRPAGLLRFIPDYQASAWSARNVDVGPLLKGDEHSIGVQPSEHGGVAVIICVCTAEGGESWRVRREVTIPRNYDADKNVW